MTNFVFDAKGIKLKKTWSKHTRIFVFVLLKLDIRYPGIPTGSDHIEPLSRMVRLGLELKT